MKALVTGMIATYPVGGVAWDYAQYALGLERLGLDVTYLEDTGMESYDPVQRTYSADCSYGVDFLARSLRSLSPRLAEQWHFRSSDGRSFGMSEESLREAVRDADVLVNVSGCTLLRDDYMSVPCKILIETDPGWNHFVNFPKWDENPGWQGSHGFRAHDAFFSYAVRMGRDDCRLPSLGLTWRPTVPPVVLDCWQPRPPAERWSTVMTWNNFGKPVEHDGVTYGTKEREFGRVEALPKKTSATLELAVGGSGAPVESWRELGWHVVDSHSVSDTPDAYRDYIERSRAELSVAKNLYVATRSGWFSCRSTCYLAAGRPVVLQDTGFSESVPCGEGVIAFSDVDGALAAIEAVEADYERHGRAAREVARAHFDSSLVLEDLLSQAGAG